MESLGQAWKNCAWQRSLHPLGVVQRRRQRPLTPERPCAPHLRSHPLAAVEQAAISEPPRCPQLALRHDLLRTVGIRLDHKMHMIRAHVESEHTPAPKLGVCPNCVVYDIPHPCSHDKRLFREALAGSCCAMGLSFEHRVPEDVVRIIDRASLITMEPRSIRRPRQEVCKRRARARHGQSVRFPVPSLARGALRLGALHRHGPPRVSERTPPRSTRSALVHPYTSSTPPAPSHSRPRSGTSPESG